MHQKNPHALLSVGSVGIKFGFKHLVLTTIRTVPLGPTKFGEKNKMARVHEFYIPRDVTMAGRLSPKIFQGRLKKKEKNKRNEDREKFQLA